MELQTYEGVVLQSRKHYQSHGNGISATLHLEFWLRFDDGREHRVHLTDVDIPIRASQRVALVYYRDRLAAVINRTTHRYLEFPPGAPAISAWRKFFTLFVPALGATLLLVGLLYWGFSLRTSPPWYMVVLPPPLVFALALVGVAWLEKPLLRQAQHHRYQLDTFHKRIAALSASRSAT